MRIHQYGLPAEPGGNALFADREWDEIADSLRLSRRELEIVQAVFEDAKELVIARRLDISPHTVHTHLERIYRKLDVNSRVQMVLRVVGRYLMIHNGLSARRSLSLSPIQLTEE